jgi:hypothetical protein
VGAIDGDDRLIAQGRQREERAAAHALLHAREAGHQVLRSTARERAGAGDRRRQQYGRSSRGLLPVRPVSRTPVAEVEHDHSEGVDAGLARTAL